MKGVTLWKSRRLMFRRKKDKTLGKYVERLAIVGQLSCGPTSLLGEAKKKISKLLIFLIVIVYLSALGVFTYYTKP